MLEKLKINIVLYGFSSPKTRIKRHFRILVGYRDKTKSYGLQGCLL